MRSILLPALLAIGINAFAQNTISVIPQPASVKMIDDQKTFSVNPGTQIILEGSNLEKAAASINDYLKKYYGWSLKIVKRSSSANTIRLNYERMDNALPGAYMLRTDDKGVYIAGDNETGVFYGVQTLLQLLPVRESAEQEKKSTLELPFVYIGDSPRFAYRGMHLDVSRHFFPISYVKRYIDYLALHKFNKFHWHLTDDQGWRIEIKKYPKLTEVGGWRDGTIIGRYPGTGNDNTHYGGFYTQDEIKEVVKYAADRYIDVIPEIEMPGHASAAIAAYPQLSCFPDEPTYSYFPKECAWNGVKTGKQVQQTWGVFEDVFCAGNDNTFTFLQDVLNEVLALFPSKYIHVGGDECPKENWKKCPKCQAKMRAENLTDEHQLQSYFIQRMEKYLNQKGRTLIGWDEILEGGLAPNAVVMSWRGEAGGITAAQQKHFVIMTPGNPVYFDHSQSQNEDSVTIGGYNSLEKVYAYEPIPEKLLAAQKDFVLGAQANLWTEYITNSSKVEYMLFPRMSALSEVLWSQPVNKNWEAFQQKLMTQFKRYELWKTNYSKAYFDLNATVLPASDNNGLLWKLESRDKSAKIVFYRDASETRIDDYKGPVRISEVGKYSAYSKSASGKNSNLISQQFYLNKATGKKITLTTPASSSYPGDGAFTLVNGIQNEKGMARSREFLGFSGTDCEATIDLGKNEMISKVIIHGLHQKGSWIWQPQTAEVFILDDSGNYKSMGLSDDFMKTNSPGNGIISIVFAPVNTKMIKIVLKNWGDIPAGNPGAGNKAWLFVDEIEVH